MGNSFKSGFAAIIGQPNVGKSTLLNRFAGGKIAITSNKPQTTRNIIRAIVTEPDYQLVFVDTPGIHAPKTRLGTYMVKSAETAVLDVDAVLFMVKPDTKISDTEISIIERLKKLKSPVFLVINKIDTVDKPKLLEIIDAYKSLMDFTAIIPISAVTGQNADDLLSEIKKVVPAGPKYFPDDMTTDQPERQIAAEIIREKALYNLEDEVPHGIAIEVTAMSARADKPILEIAATIYVDKSSHKGIIIGKAGAMLKKIGGAARVDLERIFGTQVHLELWVKVKENWKDSDFLLRNFGYREKN